MIIVRRRPILAALLAALAVALAIAAGAGAAVVNAQDAQGRTITFDVRAANVDTNWYADVLRASAHGNEISDVRILIVPEGSIAGLCGSGDAAACYTGTQGPRRIIVPAGKSMLLESILLHEYGHHLDTYWHVQGVPELNGTSTWWAARGMAARLAAHQVAFDYSLGWSHSIPEIFAEDYAYIHTGMRYAIPWLSPPDDTLKAAMISELGSAPAALPAAPEVPVVINRSGTLIRRDTTSVRFGLLGPGRRVTVNATVSRPARKGARARVQIVCDGKTVASQAFGKGRTKRTLDVPNLGPAECDARIVSNTSVALTYTLRVKLAIESA
jgi:hypothetical protein